MLMGLNVPVETFAQFDDVRVTPRGISIDIYQWPLGEALRRIEEESGIRFQIPEPLMNEPVSLSYQSGEWDEVVRTLLENFSTIEIRNDQEHLTQVWVLTKKSPVPKGETSRKGPGRGPNGITEPQKMKPAGEIEHAGEPPFPVLYKKLNELLAASPEELVSSRFMEDPDLKGFLETNGVESADDLKPANKMAALKKAAREHLKMIEEKAGLRPARQRLEQENENNSLRETQGEGG